MPSRHHYLEYTAITVGLQVERTLANGIGKKSLEVAQLTRHLLGKARRRQVLSPRSDRGPSSHDDDDGTPPH